MKTTHYNTHIFNLKPNVRNNLKFGALPRLFTALHTSIRGRPGRVSTAMLPPQEAAWYWIGGERELTDVYVTLDRGCDTLRTTEDVIGDYWILSIWWKSFIIGRIMLKFRIRLTATLYISLLKKNLFYLLQYKACEKIIYDLYHKNAF